MTKNELWTGLRGEKVRSEGLIFESWTRAGRQNGSKSPYFLALDSGRKTKRVQEPIFLALDPCGRKRSLHNAKNKSWSGLGERKCRARPGKEEKSGPRAHFSRAGSEHERKKFA